MLEALYILTELEILQIIWWGIFAFLISGFCILDGFDLGVVTLMPFLSQNKDEKNKIIETIGPVWESNQVWLILSAGAIFAIWPIFYGVLFSVLSPLIFMFLACFIIRPVALVFRDKVWKSPFDKTLCFSGIISSFLFGVIIGNILNGQHFTFNQYRQCSFHCSISNFFMPANILYGLLFLSLFTTQGLAYLFIKIPEFKPRFHRIKKFFLLSSFGIMSCLIFFKPALYIKTPLLYVLHLAFYGLWCFGGSISKKGTIFFLTSSILILQTLLYIGWMMYPNLIVSLTDPKHTLTLWNSSSSSYTLKVMLISSCILMPIVLMYISWMYRVFRKK